MTNKLKLSLRAIRRSLSAGGGEAIWVVKPFPQIATCGVYTELSGCAPRKDK